ncbi:hypothetical protein ACJX0J_022608 [Zea mays]
MQFTFLDIQIQEARASGHRWAALYNNSLMIQVLVYLFVMNLLLVHMVSIENRYRLLFSSQFLSYLFALASIEYIGKGQYLCLTNGIRQSQYGITEVKHK